MEYEVKLYNDNFQNWKKYLTCKAQLIIADPPYNLGKNAYASNPAWYKDGDNKNGESELAGKEFFDTDKDFRPAEFMHFCSQMLVKEPKTGVTDDEAETIGESGRKKSNAPCMVLFCAFEQLQYYIDLGKRYGFMHYIPLVFRKNFSAQVLKANMKIVGNCEYGLVLYKDKLPKFNNDGRMIFNCIDWVRDTETAKVHPCLPRDEKVFINDRWMKIQDVQIGDVSSYGRVIGTSTHIAEKIIEIETQDGLARATWNHPFLVLRGNEIAWVHAEQLTTKDKLLWRIGLKRFTKRQKKGISELKGMGKRKCSISLSGKNILVKFQKVIKSITLMGTRKTIELKISNLSQPLSTSGYTKVASISWTNGTSHVLYVENISDATKSIGISHEDGLTVQSARNATSKKYAQSVKFELRTVGSVRAINQKTNVYNMTIEGVPAFDTVVGCSHNTQKPVALLEELIRIFTDKGDVVIDPCAGSGTTLLAAMQLGRRAYGFEIKKNFYKDAIEKVLRKYQPKLF